MRSRLVVAVGLAACLLPVGARAAQPVDLALVLLDDVSGSINNDEYNLEKEGYLAAFRDPRVVNAITSGAIGAVAVSFVEFAGAGQVVTVLGWNVLHDAAGAENFGQRLHDAPRSSWGHTAIGDGITRGLKLLEESGVEPTRQVIDIAGDGTNNAGRPLQEARDEALHRGITINALAIANESAVPWLQAHTHPPGGLDGYFRQNVTVGETSFVLVVHDYKSFGEALIRKLIREIAQTRQHGAPDPAELG